MKNAINYPFMTEKAMMLLDSNKLQFIVDFRSNKLDIKKDVEHLYGYTVVSVCTMSTMKNMKKAIVTFEESDAAEEIATRIGLM